MMALIFILRQWIAESKHLYADQICAKSHYF